MKFLKIFNITLVVIVALVPFFSERVYAANPVSFPAVVTPLTITNPAQGQIIISSSLSITGTAPSGVIVTITIQDEDYQKTFQVHEVNLISYGTTTSDRNGDWVYVPASNLVPGRFSISAAYQNESNASVSTDKLFFTVADDSGATSWFTIPGVTLVFIFILIILVLIFIIYKIWGSKKRMMFLHTSMGDIAVREVIDNNNNIEIVPMSEPVMNIAQPIQQMPVTMMPPPLPVQQQPVTYIQQPQVIQPQPIQQNYQQAAPSVPIPQPVVNTQPVAVQPTQITHPMQQPNIVPQVPNTQIPVVQPQPTVTPVNNQNNPIQQPGQPVNQ